MCVECNISGEYYYAACNHCTSKWYSRNSSAHCPRCGEVARVVRMGPPPWLKVPCRALPASSDNRPEIQSTSETSIAEEGTDDAEEP